MICVCVFSWGWNFFRWVIAILNKLLLEIKMSKQLTKNKKGRAGRVSAMGTDDGLVFNT